MSTPFVPRPAQSLKIPDYLTFGLYIVDDDEFTPEFDEISLHKALLEHIAGSQNLLRGALNRVKTNSRLRFEMAPAAPIVAMYEDFMPFFGISEEYQARMRAAGYLIAVVTEQDLTTDKELSALRMLELATAVTARARRGLILDPLSYKVFDYADEACADLLSAFEHNEKVKPLAPLLSVVQTKASEAPGKSNGTMTSTSGLCRFNLPEVIIETAAAELAPAVEQLARDIAVGLLSRVCEMATQGEKEMSLKAPLVVSGGEVTGREVPLRLQAGRLGPVLTLDLHGRQGDRDESLRALL